MDNQSIITLLQKHLAHNASEEERAELMEWLAQVNGREFDEVIESFPNEFAKLKEINEQFAQKQEARIDAIEMEESEVSVALVHRIHFLRTAWFRYAAAIVLFVGVGTYLYLHNQKEKPSVTQANPIPVQNDVAPGGNKATLTLADGSKIILDSAANGLLAEEGKTTIEKKGNQIIYNSSVGSRLSSLVSFNTMATPRGGQYQLTLPDNTQVWLNAESSITYPTAFNGKERTVSITGEAYFEVAKDKTKPFIVSVKTPHASRLTPHDEQSELDIEVLGTHFNVNAYKEESSVNTTLLEGSVRLTPHDSRLTNSDQKNEQTSVHTSLTLKPGQQGQLTDRGLFLAAHPDVEQVMAWKNGAFNFNGTDIEAAMRQMSRWYDISIVYDNGIPQGKFGGEMGRNLTLQQVLKGLEGVSARFKLEGKTLHVLPLSTK